MFGVKASVAQAPDRERRRQSHLAIDHHDLDCTCAEPALLGPSGETPHAVIEFYRLYRTKECGSRLQPQLEWGFPASGPGDGLWKVEGWVRLRGL